MSGRLISVKRPVCIDSLGGRKDGAKNPKLTDGVLIYAYHIYLLGLVRKNDRQRRRNIALRSIEKTSFHKSLHLVVGCKLTFEISLRAATRKSKTGDNARLRCQSTGEELHIRTYVAGGVD